MDKLTTTLEEIEEQINYLLPANNQTEDKINQAESIQKQLLRDKIDRAANFISDLRLHQENHRVAELIIKLYDASGIDWETRKSLAKGLQNSVSQCESFQDLKKVVEIAISVPELPSPYKEKLEKEILSKLVPFLRNSYNCDDTINLIHWVCIRMTDDGLTFLCHQLLDYITDSNLTFSAYEAIFDLMISQPALQEELPRLCAEKMMSFVSKSKDLNSALGLIIDSFRHEVEPFKAHLITLLQQELSVEDLYYAPEIFDFLLHLIEYSYQIPDTYIEDHEALQLTYVRGLLKISETQADVDYLHSILHEQSGKFNKALKLKSRLIISVWLILAPVIRYIPHSKIKVTVDAWQLHTFPEEILFRSLTAVFDILLPLNFDRDRHLQICRSFINGIGQLMDTGDEEISGQGEEILLCVKQYIIGVSDQEFKEWQSICQQVWLSDSRKSMPNVDRVRKATRKVLEKWIDDIFDR
ncbi:MAG: hypothetical protein NZ961_26735 [Candidatus Poribacteria bacterium]|nr:hypothetical protein [Candidatus Poribacteria bacterium]